MSHHASTSRSTIVRPRALLVDYGGTLVEEIGYDVRAGVQALLAYAREPVGAGTVAAIETRIDRITRDVANRRDALGLETPWPALTRLIYDPLGIAFTRPLDELESIYWNAIAVTRPQPGVREALESIHALGVPIAVVANASFRSDVLRGELAKHGLAERITFVVSSAEYAVRKPNPLLFEVAAARLGVSSHDAWFVGDRLDTDVAGARAAGMHPIHYAPTGGDGARDWPGIARDVRACITSHELLD